MVAALSSGSGFDVFTEPYGQYIIKDRNDIEVTLLLVLVGIAVTEIALWGRRQEARASRRAGYLDGVLGTSKVIALREASSDDKIDLVADQIVQVLDMTNAGSFWAPGQDRRMPALTKTVT
jgi:chloramphenicol 3-O-phosphotransferase